MNSCAYWDMIDWHKDLYTDPPILTKYSMEDLEKIVLEHKNSKVFLDLVHIPYHTQAVERAVKLLTESSLVLSDGEKRDGVIRNTLVSRKTMPKCDSKKDLISL